MPTIQTFLLPGMIDPARLRGVAVVIDQLRASTTICAAIAAGARGVYTFATVDEAHEHARTNAELGPYLLGGEREGVRIPGFDLDNSPRAYSTDRVAGKTILFTTTNGTQAIRACTLAQHETVVMIGCLGNLSALVENITFYEDQPTSLVCAGTHGKVSLDDVLAAGAIAERLMDNGWTMSDSDDGTRVALDVWRQASSQKGGVVRALLDSLGGRNLCRIGLRSDVEFCAGIDNVPHVPRLFANGFQHEDAWA